MRQLIIARKDLPMSAGKLAAQVSHASMAWLSNLIRTASRVENGNGYRVTVDIDADIYDESRGDIALTHDELEAMSDDEVKANFDKINVVENQVFKC